MNKAARRTILIFVFIIPALLSFITGHNPTAQAAVIGGSVNTDITWELNEASGVLTLRGTGAIPDFGADYPEWLIYSEGVRTVVIEEGITHVGAYAFSQLSHFTSLSLPSTLQSIGTNAFSNCSALHDVTLPDGLTEIDSYAFFYCESLQTIHIPDSVTEIGFKAFAGCRNLKQIFLGKQITDIGKSAFENCPVAVVYYAGNKDRYNGISMDASLDNFAFHAQWVFDYKPEEYIFDGDILFSKDKTELISYPSYLVNRHFIVPDTVQTIAQSAFRSAVLESVSLPKGLVHIESKAFWDCPNLTRICIPTGVSRIGNSAFYNCNSLSDVYFCGSEEEWQTITISSDNAVLQAATIHFDHTHNFSNWSRNEAAARWERICTDCDFMEFSNKQEPPAYPGYGDINNDGVITSADARLALRASVGIETLSDEQILLCDVNASGFIEASDARLILRFSVGLETGFPAQS